MKKNRENHAIKEGGPPNLPTPKNVQILSKSVHVSFIMIMKAKFEGFAICNTTKIFKWMTTVIN